MTMRRVASCLAVAVGLISRTVTAQTVTFQPGTPVNTTGVTGFATTGSLMDGMQVFWTLLGGGSGSGTWGFLGGGLSGVSGGGFTLSIGSTTDTFGNPFLFTNNTGAALTSVTLSGASGRTLFDCGWLPPCVVGTGALEGSPGSASGWTAQTAGGTYLGPVSAIYSNIVSFGVNPPVGDLFEQLQLLFGTGGMSSGLNYQLIADTDNSPFNQPPPTSVTPEPSSLVLLATGMFGLAILHSRRRKSS